MDQQVLCTDVQERRNILKLQNCERARRVPRVGIIFQKQF